MSQENYLLQQNATGHHPTRSKYRSRSAQIGLLLWACCCLLISGSSASSLCRPGDAFVDGWSQNPKRQWNEPSKFEEKMQNDQPGSCDPVIDHLMSSRAFNGVIWSFFVALVGV